MREHALRLGGHDPKDLFHDPAVMTLNRAYLGGIGGPGSFTAEGAADAFVYDRAEEMSQQEYERRLGWIVDDLPTKEDGRAILRQYVDQHLAALTERRELIALREERNVADALGEARSSVSPEGDRRQRYAAQSTRLSQAAIRLLFAMQHERRKYGEGDLDGLNPVPGPAAEAAAEASETAPETETGAVVVPDEQPAASTPVVEAPPTGVAPAGESDWKNEPQPTQVAGGMGRNDAISPHVAAAGDTQVLLSESDHEARRAVYRRTLGWLEAELRKSPDRELYGFAPES